METIGYAVTLGLLIVFTICGIIGFLLNLSLRQLLVDLCGSEQRSKFWGLFSQVNLVLVPLVFCTFAIPADGREPLIVQIMLMVRWGAIGLVFTLAVLGMTLKSFIPVGGAK